MPSDPIPCLILAAFVACSSGTGGPTRAPVPGPTPDGTVAHAANSPTERECDSLFAHAIAIRISEQRQALPPEQVPTEDEQALHAELRGSYLADCLAGSREAYACGIAARSLGELAACQSMRSSSTSNSSVAPGGIAPGAPRSP